MPSRLDVMVVGGPPLVLASGSAARRALLAAAGLRFAVRPVALDEAALKRALAGGEPGAVAQALADAKAALVDAPEAVVIAADQLLELDGVWFDKPADLGAARVQLLRLRGRTHALHVAVTCVHAGRVWRHCEVARLAMRAFSDAFLEWYLASEGEALLGCVGAYRLEGLGVQLFERVEGDHSAILGLPMVPVLGCLRDWGVALV